MAHVNYIFFLQSAPKSSPLTFGIDGDASSNQWEVSQNAADESSTLTCTPDCPQQEYVEEENDYNDEANNVDNNDNNSNDNNNNSQDVEQNYGSSNADIENDNIDNNSNSNDNNNHSNDHTDNTSNNNSQDVDENYGSSNADIGNENVNETDNEVSAYSESSNVQHDDQYDHAAEESGSNQNHLEPETSVKKCPGGNIDECINVCPYSPALAFKYCVAECGKRCP